MPPEEPPVGCSLDAPGLASRRGELRSSVRWLSVPLP